MIEINKPNLFIVGFPKSGSSSLFDYLGQHEDIFTSFRKEPHFYSIDGRYIERFNSEEYLSFQNLYSKATNEKYIVDASTTYMISDIALKRIKKDCPKAKIIIIARDPIERVFSHYDWINSLGVYTKSFKREILKWEKTNFDPKVDFKGNFKNYIQFSKYGCQIEKCLEVFPKEQILIIPFEKLKEDSISFMKVVFEFLDLEPIELNIIIKNPTNRNQVVKIKYPTKLKTVILFCIKLMNLDLNDFSFFFNKKANKVKRTVRNERFIFNLLKSDLKILHEKKMLFNEWDTTSKFFNK